MKNKIYQSLALIFVLQVFFLMTSCDPVAADDRYIELEKVTSERVVLLEEFTGQNCVNCPSAHRTIEALQEQYGESLISVSIHAGAFAIEEGKYESRFQTFKTPEGDTYADQWNVTAFPCGIVNRRSGIQMQDEWAASVYSEMQRPSSLAMSLEASVNASGSIDVKATLLPGEDLDGMLQLWVVEDSIVSYQLDGSTRLMDYEHNNVYRASVNGVGGEAVGLQRGIQQEFLHNIDVNERWNPEHLRIVGFVYNKQEVVQACQCEVK